MLDPNAGLNMNFPGLNPADIKNDLARLKSGMPPMGVNTYRVTDFMRNSGLVRTMFISLLMVVS
eukprot:7847869-Pyramimonas_sp.AAC.1